MATMTRDYATIPEICVLTVTLSQVAWERTGLSPNLPVILRRQKTTPKH